MNQDIKAVTYSRVSTQDQTSETQQVKDIKEKINRIWVKDYSEKKTAVDKEDVFDTIEYMKLRPEFYQMYLDAQKGLFKEIWVWKWDRFARSDFQEIIIKMFKKFNVDVFVLIGSKERLGRKIESIISIEEIENTRIRVNDKHNNLIEEGRLLNRPPFGYKYSKTLKKLVPSKDAETVKKIFELAKTKSVKEISKELGLTELKIYRILKNRTYLGELCYKKVGYKGTHEAIIDKELFDKINWR